MSTYEAGLDVLGAGGGIGDFVPWLGVVGKLLGGGGGGSESGKSSEDAIRRALEEERQRQAMEKARADAQRTQMIMFGGLGLLGLGGIFLLLRR